MVGKLTNNLVLCLLSQVDNDRHVNVHKNGDDLPVPLQQPSCLSIQKPLGNVSSTASGRLCPASQPHILQGVNQMPSLLIRVILTSLFFLGWMNRGHQPLLNDCNCIKELWLWVILLQKASFSMGHCRFYFKEINPSEGER